MDIDDIDQKTKQEWSLLYPMVDLFKQIEEWLEFAEDSNTTTPGEKFANMAYLLKLKTGGTEKSCEQR